MKPSSSRRGYFVAHEPALAATLDGFLRRLAEDLETCAFRDGVAALILGGGYGRGEGGVFRRKPGAPAELYNDLEFYVFVRERPNARALAAWCHRWERDGTRELGIDVEFKRLPAAVFSKAAPTLFFFDLLQGHRLIWGSEAVLAAAGSAHRDAAHIPLSEPARLLFNRGSGLLYARWRLEEQPDDSDGFVERNHAKARLALADAVLAAAGRHDSSCLERHQRLAGEEFPTPPNFARLYRWHAEGVRFKLEPRHRHPGAAALAAENRELTAAWLDVFLWLESRRLGRSLSSGEDYVDLRLRLFPESPRRRNLALHVRDRLRRGAALPGCTDYPRAALQRALVAAHLERDEQRAAAEIGVPHHSWRTTYRRWWGFYN